MSRNASFLFSDKSCLALAAAAGLLLTVGLLAEFAAPALLISTEKSRAAEGYQYLQQVRARQEAFSQSNGRYAADLTELDSSDPPKGFSAIRSDSATASDGTTWQVTLQRVGFCAGFGAYTMTFNQNGYLADESTVDLYPDISPIERGAAAIVLRTKRLCKEPRSEVTLPDDRR